MLSYCCLGNHSSRARARAQSSFQSNTLRAYDPKKQGINELHVRASHDIDLCFLR